MKNILTENKFEVGVLRSTMHAVGSGLDAVDAAISVEDGVSTSLTFEQRSELLPLHSEVKKLELEELPCESK